MLTLVLTWDLGRRLWNPACRLVRGCRRAGVVSVRLPGQARPDRSAGHDVDHAGQLGPADSPAQGAELARLVAGLFCRRTGRDHQGGRRVGAADAGAVHLCALATLARREPDLGERLALGRRRAGIPAGHRLVAGADVVGCACARHGRVRGLCQRHPVAPDRQALRRLGRWPCPAVLVLPAGAGAAFFPAVAGLSGRWAVLAGVASRRAMRGCCCCWAGACWWCSFSAWPAASARSI